MGFPVLVLLLLLAAALPDLVPSVLAIDRHPPDLWVALTAYLALRARGYQAVGWAILVGLGRDVLSLDPLGTHAFVLGFVAWLFAEGRGSRGRVDGMLRVTWTFLATLVAGALYLVRVLPMGGGGVTFSAFVAILPRALWTAVFAVPLFSLLDRTRALDDLCGRVRTA